MDTKWKNIIKEKARILWGILRRHKKAVFGALLFGVGLFVFISMMFYPYSDTRSVWAKGIPLNIFWGAGICCILPEILERCYRSWVPQNEEFYAQWKAKWAKQQKILLAVFAVFLFLCFWYWSYQKYQFNYGWGWNYARGYLSFATLFVQGVLLEVIVIRFMLGRLNLLMERMEKINQDNLKNALEIEKRSLEKVSRSDQLRVDLITNVSHDLKTPLTSMVGYIELLKKEDLNDISRDYVEVISGRATKLKEMIESLFSLAKASSGNVEFHMETIELNRLMGQIFADMQDRMQESNLEFVTMYTEEDTHMVSDNAYMYRICQNLMENALKYSAKGTRVFVRTGVNADGWLCLEITNTAGYRMDFSKEDIVERFARADKARASDGNGLGLAIVSSYTKALGGDFDILLDCDQFKARLLFPREKLGKQQSGKN